MSSGHGLADPNYRPPRVPYVSVIGPLNLETESERDPTRADFLWIRTPGHAAGAERSAADIVPAGGQLHLRLDGDATASLVLAFDNSLAGQPLTDDATARAVAAVIATALAAAVTGGQFMAGGVAVSDAARRAELAAATVRWDRHRRRFVISSGRRGPMTGLDLAESAPSRVEVLDGAASLAPVLGFGAEGLEVEGRIVRHRVPAPSGVALDVRLDLWAGSQQELAVLMETWARITPTRGQLVVQPALLLADAEDGATSVRLQARGESPTRWTLAQLEPEHGFAERLSEQAPELTAGASVEADALRLVDAGTATWSVYEAPPVPYPWLGDHPGPAGFAVSLGLRADADPSAGQVLRIFSLEHGPRQVLRLEVAYVAVNGGLRAELRATAQQASGTPFAAAVSQVDPAVLEAEGGAELHATVDAARGEVRLFLDGSALPAAGTPVPGTPAGGHDLRLVLGPSGNTAGFRLTHLQLHGRPLGPADPRLRESLSGAAAWSAGDSITLASTEDGHSAGGEGFAARVIAVSGSTLTLDRPVEGRWPRASTLAYQRRLFFSQKQLRRRDDLMNHLYRITLEYRVSAFLEEQLPGVSAPLAEITDEQVRDLPRLAAETENPENPQYPVRPVQGRPGTRALITSPVVRGSTTEGGKHA